MRRIGRISPTPPRRRAIGSARRRGGVGDIRPIRRMALFPSPLGERVARRKPSRERGMKRARAKQLRSQQTDAEMRLWYFLRAHRFGGFKFKRQAPIGPYIVDFICFE